MVHSSHQDLPKQDTHGLLFPPVSQVGPSKVITYLPTLVSEKSHCQPGFNLTSKALAQINRPPGSHSSVRPLERQVLRPAGKTSRSLLPTCQDRLLLQNSWWPWKGLTGETGIPNQRCSSESSTILNLTGPGFENPTCSPVCGWEDEEQWK